MSESPEVRTQTYSDTAIWYENDRKGTVRPIDFTFPSDEDREVTVWVYNPSQVTDIDAGLYAIFPAKPGEKQPNYEPLNVGKAKPGKRLELRATTARPIRVSLMNTKPVGPRALRVRIDIEAKYSTENTVEWLGKTAVLVKGPEIHKVYLGVEDDEVPFEEGAKITIDLKTGQVRSRLDYDEGTKVLWAAVSDFGGASVGEGRRCSCECGCNRKLATNEVLRKKCFACDVDMHEGGKAS